MRKKIAGMFKLVKKIQSKNGSILAETIIGVAIYAIVIVAFAEILVTASTLFLRAQVGAREWERIFVKMENQDYSTAVSQSPEFNLVLKAADIKYSDIILPNDMPYSNSAGSVSLAAVPSVTLVKNQVFKRFEEEVEHFATSNPDDKVYVYLITGD